MTEFVDNLRTWEKFDRSGTALRHPGTTFVAEAVEGSPLYSLGRRIQDDVRARGWASDFGLTVPSSFHMTVLAGLKGPHFDGQSEAWPAWLSDSARFPEAALLMLERLQKAEIRGPRDMRMVSPGVYPLARKLTLRLEPADEDVANELARFRREVGEVLEIPVEAPGDYAFHSTFGYRLTKADVEDPELVAAADEYNSWVREIDVFEVDAPAYCIFNDMQSFAPLLYFR
ncbi:DUF1868 domain-containing protein [Corynebacterium timonense]|uniref:DUF1868 domain-containing protein n=1 Tax=Corynebacterium timonense TaxID=441500 RepID=A0A1H1S901_9CORY|nr:DUF1868 domain-containing protein [Corynebacterium timonense]SDS44600.1 hypothetical protein SAMN04488539_1692 [Corynebacterium timonense]